MNTDLLGMIILTFDTDWAPSFVMESVLNKLKCAQLKATFFCTSPVDIENKPNIEFGIHPNFMNDSTQGSSEKKILEHLTALFPAAVGMRTHRLYWHSGLNKKLLDYGILYDASIMMPFHANLGSVTVGQLIRFPTWWSDNIHLTNGLPLDRVELPNMNKPGLKIFNFHPIHIYLNTNSMISYYEKMKRLHPIRKQSPAVLSRYREKGEGIGTFFDLFCEYIIRSQSTTYCLHELLK